MSIWKLDMAIPDGHRFYANREGRIAIADNSGDTPEDTDDGILWLDGKRPILITSAGGALRCAVPAVIARGGRTSQTFETLDGGLRVARRYRMRVEVAPGTTNYEAATLLAEKINDDVENSVRVLTTPADFINRLVSAYITANQRTDSEVRDDGSTILWLSGDYGYRLNERGFDRVKRMHDKVVFSIGGELVP